MLSPQAAGAFCTIFFGYQLHSLLLQYLFYYRRPKDTEKWKIQPESKSGSVGVLWGWPLLSSKPNRGPYHRYLTTFNLVVASTAALVTTECAVRGANFMTFEPLTAALLPALVGQLLLATCYQCVAEFYWHLLMHTRLCYAAFHKMHHHYKSPEPWDDMYIHPVEALGYYFILYGPPFLFPIHYAAFIAYMIVMGVCGVLDHCGVRFEVPGLYNTADHDRHHAKFEVNYSFPFPYLDLLHGTFDGEFLGQTFSRKRTIYRTVREWAAAPST